jgi:hypothetical protein
MMKCFAIIFIIIALLAPNVHADSWAQFCWDADGNDPFDPEENGCKGEDFYVHIHYESGDAMSSWRWRLHTSVWGVWSGCLDGDVSYDDVIGPFNTDLNEARIWLISYDLICDIGYEALFTQAIYLEDCAWTPTPPYPYTNITQTPSPFRQG